MPSEEKRRMAEIKSSQINIFKNYQEELLQATATLNSKNYHTEIINSFHERGFEEKWTALKKEIENITSIKEFNIVVKELGVYYRLILDTINAPECKKFIDWVKNQKYPRIINEDQIETLEKEIIANYADFAHDFKEVSEILNDLNNFIAFPKFRKSLIKSFLENLSKLAKESDIDEDTGSPIDTSEVKTFFSDALQLLTNVKKIQWCQYSPESLSEIFGLHKKLPDKKRFLEGIFDLIDQPLNETDFKNIEEELKFRQESFSEIITCLKSDFNIDLVSNHETFIWRHWLRFFLKVVNDSKRLDIEEPLHDKFKSSIELLNNLIEDTNRVYQYKPIDLKTIDSMDDFLDSIPDDVSGGFRNCLKRLKKFYDIRETESIVKVKPLDQIRNWLDDKTDEIDFIERRKSKSIDAAHKSLEKEIETQKKNFIDLTQIINDSGKLEKSRKALTTTKRINSEFQEKSKEELGDFIMFLSTFYDELNKFNKEFKVLMFDKLNKDDLELRAKVYESKELDSQDILEALKDKSNSLATLYKYSLIDITVTTTKNQD